MKKIIIPLILFLLASFSFLSYRESQMQNLQSQNWWSIYFTDAKSDNLNFVIENNSDSQNFHYEISVEKNKIKEENIQINKGEKKEINLSKSDFMFLESQKIIIKVSDGKNSKEIYKTF